MIKSYFKIGWRNLLRNKAYAAINIGGLAVGLSAFMIIVLYVQHEFSYDRFYPHADRIYRIYQKQSGNVFLGTDFFAVTPSQLASILEDEFPEVEKASAVTNQSALLSLAGQHYWQRGLAGDPHFFDIFSFDFVSGNPQTVFNDPKSIVLTATLAKKIFGPGDPMGQSLRYQNSETYTVTGVVKDPPANSTLQFSFIVNILSFDWYASEFKRPTWRNNNVHTFLLLREHAAAASLQGKFKTLIKKHQDPKEYANYPFKDEYFLQALPGLHLAPAINFDFGVKGNQRYLYLFSCVALCVLLLACVNYMSLAITRSISRAREVGMRKVAGALRTQIIGQFLGESVLTAFLSLLMALLLASLLLPPFSRLIDRTITLDFAGNTWLIPGLLVLVILVGLFSGSYPSFVLSSLRPIQVLKGKMDSKLSSFRIQRWLIVGQFAVSIILVICSVVVYRQLEFMKQKELGYDRSNVIAVQLRDRSLMQHYEAMVNTWQQHPAIVATTSSNELLTNITSSTIINDEDGSGKEDDLAIYEWYVNYNFSGVFGTQLIAGRYFSNDIKTDPQEAVLLNATAAKALGWTPREAIGKQFIHDGPKTVVGVIKDFHMHSMHLAIQPLMVRLHTSWANYISVKVQPGKSNEALALLETTVRKYSPYPFDYQFLDDHFNQLYSTEMKMGEVFAFFTVVSILIASLGLFGLAAFTAHQRTKEIGIRKTLGASVNNIVALLTKGFLWLIVLAFALAVPVAWYVMHAWLQEFAYRIDMAWWVFAGAGMLALVMAGMAIGYQSLKASVANPVESLRE